MARGVRFEPFAVDGAVFGPVLIGDVVIMLSGVISLRRGSFSNLLIPRVGQR